MISEVFNQDCLEAMREMPDKAFSLAIVDPPYGIGNWVQTTGNIRGQKIDWNNATPLAEFFLELKRVSKEQIIWGANYFNSFSAKGGAIVWYKHQPNPNFSACEIASYSRLKRVDFVDLRWTNIHREEITIHPCQKPVRLYAYLLRKYAPAEGKILDTHLGSGSSRIAAYDLGFDFVGYELDKDYFEAQELRFQNHIKQPKLFEPIQTTEQAELFASK